MGGEEKRREEEEEEELPMLAAAHNRPQTCVVFINAITHSDPLCPTSVGSNPQQQGEGGGGEGQ